MNVPTPPTGLPIYDVVAAEQDWSLSDLTEPLDLDAVLRQSYRDHAPSHYIPASLIR